MAFWLQIALRAASTKIFKNPKKSIFDQNIDFDIFWWCGMKYIYIYMNAIIWGPILAAGVCTKHLYAGVIRVVCTWFDMRWIDLYFSYLLNFFQSILSSLAPLGRLWKSKNQKFLIHWFQNLQNFGCRKISKNFKKSIFFQKNEFFCIDQKSF